MCKMFVSLMLFCLWATCVFSLELNKKFVDYRLLPNARLMQRSSSAPICTAPGPACSYNCLNVYRCIDNNGMLQPLLIEDCQKNNQTCNNGKCSDTPTLACSPAGKLPFICQAEGFFPDPIDCRNYHICITNASATGFDDNPRTCTPYGYNPGTTHCQNILEKNQCPPGYPVPLCTTSGQTNTVPESDSMYYVCGIHNGILYPFFYICPNGKIYNPADYSCRRRPRVTTVTP